MLKRIFQAAVSPEAVAEASRWARALAEDLRLPQEDATHVDLVLTEVLQNIVDHAGASANQVPLVVEARVKGGELGITVLDSGRPFDPLKAPAPVLAASIESAPLGGLGLKLVAEFTEHRRYERRGERNCLELGFKLPAPMEPPRSQRVARGSDRRRHRAEPRFPLLRASGASVIEEQRSARDRRLTGFISRAEIFRDVSYAQVEEIVAGFPIKDIADRTVLLRPGDCNDQVLVVLRGTLRVYIDSLDAPEHVEIGVGGCVGEMSVIDDKPISAYVVAEAGCRLLLIDAASFLTRILSIAQVGRNLLSTLSARTRRSDAIIIAQFKAKLELEQLQRDLRHARSIQSSMLPRAPLFEGLAGIDCVGNMRAAKDVGGDFYDAALIDTNRAFVAVGDVCDKGLPAALFMVRALTTLRTEVMRPGRGIAARLRAAIDRTNRELNVSNEAQQFVTLFCGVLDLEARTLTYVNAGHNAALFASTEGQFEFLAEPGNPIVGIVDGLSYESGTVPMPPGSTLVLYTDGVTEAVDPRGAMFGDDRLRALVRQAPGAGASELVDHIVAAVDAFAAGAPQSDDITVLALRFTGAVAC